MSDDPEEDKLTFDPEIILAAEAKAYETSEANEPVLAAYINRRLQAYRAVFVTGTSNEDDRKFVMNDLAVWTRAYQSTWNKNQKVQDVLEGRREVFMRIMEITTLDHETQFVKYMSAITAQRNT